MAITSSSHCTLLVHTLWQFARLVALTWSHFLSGAGTTDFPIAPTCGGALTTTRGATQAAWAPRTGQPMGVAQGLPGCSACVAPTRITRRCFLWAPLPLGQRIVSPAQVEGGRGLGHSICCRVWCYVIRWGEVG